MDPEVQRLINLLRTTARILGITNRDIERKLGLSPSHLSRLYSGDIELKAEHLVRIPAAMGLEPAELFHLAYPRRLKPSQAAELWPGAARTIPPTDAVREGPEAG
jgi:transcriptional regulator with XRE-family HTH domain